ncbi:Heat shock protein DnaJ N-terminal [Penicillium bovifimosum]|uniref:Heat shock protein DnaJ N-terminal n=1 Tax=Penicillium bovifimosum TaxID=126998 RepID=A0A9W9GU59_9EURO|nr:Heat shock protein DnaJ N-terminal [Penicillium bovifimosum]KAJ5129923.1 Heat shock protein DnaJ N-terminal [Penicillium bovifimosum]
MSTLKVTIDAYAILAVPRDASTQEINAAYKRLALKAHPDHAGNTEAANEQFRELKEAVEILRDPQSRDRLDAQLNVQSKRARASAAEEHTASHWTSAGRNDTRRGKREWRSERQSDHQWTNYRDSNNNFTQFESYLRTYGASCHMDPNSAESKAKRAQYKAENEQWAREWAGFDEEVEKAREELRKEKMRARHNEDVRTRMMRDIHIINKMVDRPDPLFEDLVSRVVSNGIDEIEANNAKNARRGGDHRREEASSTFNPSDMSDDFAYVPGSSWYPGNNRMHYSTARGAPSPPRSSTNSTSYYSAGEYSPASNVSSERHDFPTGRNWGGHSSSGSSPTSSTSSRSSAHSDVPPTTFSATNPLGNSPEAFRAACENISSIVKDVRAAVLYPNISLNVDRESIRPLVPYFNQKLADPLGRYTMKDYESELNGIMLEMYSGWLNDIRLSIPGARPIPAVRLDRRVCPHTGIWKKEFCRPMCEACEAWMPLFTLTCQTCHFKACLKCKYEVDALACLHTGI